MRSYFPTSPAPWPTRGGRVELESSVSVRAEGPHGMADLDSFQAATPPGARRPTGWPPVRAPPDPPPAPPGVRATVGGAALWSHAEIVVLHGAGAELPPQPGSFLAPGMIAPDCYDWSDWREEFVRR